MAKSKLVQLNFKTVVTICPVGLSDIENSTLQLLRQRHCDYYRDNITITNNWKVQHHWLYMCTIRNCSSIAHKIHENLNPTEITYHTVC